MKIMLTLDNLEKIFSIITGIFTICITIWVLFVGKSQFEENLKITKEQLKLYKTERKLTIESGVPILAISTSGFTHLIENNYFDYLLKLENFGERPAYSIRLKLYSICYDENNVLVIIDKFDEISANPITKGMKWDVGRNFSTRLKSKIYLYTIIEYQDLVTKKINLEKYLFFIPENKYLVSGKEGSLINASFEEKGIISKFIDDKF